MSNDSFRAYATAVAAICRVYRAEQQAKKSAGIGQRFSLNDPETVK
ncbi:MAG: hypothetical protein KUF74_08255 [Candidatus Thiodiazotropha sp. (ex Ctena orbiculata)]|nr:hypothetical protein [Candidatus Thiodiazotropha taylori]